VFLIVTPATLLIALVARPFLTLWAGPAFGVHGTELLLVALVGAWANALAWVPTSYMRSAAKLKPLAWLQVVELGPYLAGAWILTARWGALGAAIVWSARLVLDCIARFVMVHRSAGLPWIPLSQRRLRSLAAPAFLAIACLGAASLTGGMAARTGSAILLATAYSVGVGWFVLSRRERRGISALAQEMVGRKMTVRRRRPARSPLKRPTA
jgi:O-antigen/teichoic acid export membrane protein